MSRVMLPVVVFVLAALPVRAQEDGKSAAVDRIFVEWNGKETPGCAVGVAQDGRTIFARAYGMAELEHGVQNTPETIFEAGSVSKQFTAAATVLLAQEGRLSLDDDVRKHVPELPDYGTPVTIRHLLNHTSGLRDWGSEIGYAAGLMMGNYNGVAEVSHTGATGGYRAFLGRYPERRISVAMLCNAGDADRGSAGRRIADAFLGTSSRPAAQQTQPQPSDRRPTYVPASAMLQSYVGEYYSPDAEVTFTIAVGDDQLIMLRRPDVRLVMRPVEPHVFQVPDLGRVRFIAASSGRVDEFGVNAPRVFDLRFDRVKQP